MTAAPSLDELRLFAASSPAGFGWAMTKDDPEPYRPARFHLELAKAIVDVEQGRLDVLIVQIPVQHGKSELASRLAAAWYLGLHPERYVLAASYATEFAANRIGKPARDYLERAGMRFFGVGVDPTSSARGAWNTTRGGGMTATGVEAGIAGRRVDWGVIDDPYANLEQASSKAHRDRAWDWYRFEFATRFAPRAGQIHIMSRWGDDDHVARMIKLCEETGIRWRLVDFPALAICSVCGDYGIDAVNQCGHGVRDSLGRLPGEALWPEVRPREFLLQQRKFVGSRAFDALYQGRPRPDGGLMFGEEWFRYYDHAGDRLLLSVDGRVRVAPLAACRIFQMVDPAASTDPTAARFRIGTFAMTPQRDLAILDMQGGTLGAPRSKKLVKAQYLLHRPQVIGVEKNGLGLPIVQDLIADHLPIKPIDAGKDKISRASVAAILYENGQVFHPRDAARAPWRPEMETELKQFPAGAYKDQVDVISMAAIAVSQAGAGGSPAGIRVG